MELSTIYIWQRIISPHMAGLASALASEEADVIYVAEQKMSETRARQGWRAPPLGKARLLLAPTASDVAEIVNDAPSASIHICQGIRGNGLIGTAQILLAKKGIKPWVVMETVDDAGFPGFLKRLAYYRLFNRRRASLEGVLATGWQTADWIAERGFPLDQTYPFAYFLPESSKKNSESVRDSSRHFRFLFVGQLIPLKRVDLLIRALSQVDQPNFEFVIVGEGPEESRLKTLAETLLPGQTQWLGRLLMEQARAEMAEADCLVLPSRHDGWGAVVSEALIAGTPAVCSDACGSAGAVKASGFGGVFPVDDINALKQQLECMILRGPLTTQERSCLAQWSRCLGADAGAKYLIEILQHRAGDSAKPVPPWERGSLS